MSGLVNYKLRIEIYGFVHVKYILRVQLVLRNSIMSGKYTSRTVGSQLR